MVGLLGYGLYQTSNILEEAVTGENWSAALIVDEEIFQTTEGVPKTTGK